MRRITIIIFFSLVTFFNCPNFNLDSLQGQLQVCCDPTMGTIKPAETVTEYLSNPIPIIASPLPDYIFLGWTIESGSPAIFNAEYDKYKEAVSIRLLSNSTTVKAQFKKYSETRIKDIAGKFFNVSMRTYLLANYGETLLADISSLDLSNKDIKEILGLQDLHDLKNLNLSHNQIIEIDSLAGLNQLSQLDLSNNNIGVDQATVLFAISQRLEKFDMADNPLKRDELQTLGSLPEGTNPTLVTSLDISNQFITSLEGLKYLIRLTSLTLNGNPGITDYSPLAKISTLTNLSASGNDLVSIDFLSDLTNLEKLTLDNNAITDLSPLQKLSGLNFLSLNNNAIPDLGVLGNLKNLQKLYLDNNSQIDDSDLDIAILRQLTKLTHISIRNTAVSEQKYYALLNAGYTVYYP